MIVVADTTPLNYLIQIGEVDVLPELYKSVLIPEQVHREMQRAKAPAKVRDWAQKLPAWCEVRRVEQRNTSGLEGIDAGEREAILLAIETNAELLLMDDAKGRRAALRNNLEVAGTLAVLRRASKRGLLDFRSALRKLDQTNFRMADDLRESFLSE